MGYKHRLLFLLILMFASSKCQSWSWFSYFQEAHSTDNPSCNSETCFIAGLVSEFSMEGFNDPKGTRLVDTAKKKLKLDSLSPCWKKAYLHLFSGCSEIFAADEKRKRFAWHLSDCFQKDSGRSPFPSCHQKSAMAKCLKNLNEYEHKVYLEFYLETNSICHQLQVHFFKHETERLVNDLRTSALYAEQKLETIEERTGNLLKGSDQIHDSLNWIGNRTQQVAQTTKKVEDDIDVLSKQSEALYEQSRKITTSQEELQQGQVEMKKNIKEGMEMLQDSYSDLGEEIGNLRNETVEIEKEITKVGDLMSSKMKYLQSKADDIGNMAGVSLDKQHQLLDGQTTALQDLEFLTKFQSEALEESRTTLQRLAEYGHRQQEELLQRQKQLQQVHDHLMDNSKSILAAQESFESKQAIMFVTLDKLFALYNASWLESPKIKAFLFYCISVFVIYKIPSTKRTYTLRPWLYIGLSITFFLEVAIPRSTTYDIEQQTWLVRSIFVLLAFIKFIHAYCTYRDYKVLNHQKLETNRGMLENLTDKVKVIEPLIGTLTQKVNDIETLIEKASNGMQREFHHNQVAENSITTISTATKYNLRSRLRLLENS